MKKIIYLILIILWMSIIFIYSNFKGVESTAQSDGIINSTIRRVVNLFDLEEETKDKIIDYSTLIVRKIAHVSEYFILSILVYLYINEYNIIYSKKIYITILICFIYAISDEVHQLFIVGRSGNIIDVIIDTLGAYLYLLLNKIFRKDRV